MPAEDQIKDAILRYERLSKQKRSIREARNTLNWDIFNLRQDFTHKSDTQSQEFIPQLALTVEQVVATVLAGLTGRSDKFFNVEESIIPDEIFDATTKERIIAIFTKHSKAINFFAESIKYVALDGTVTAKVGSRVDTLPRWEAERGIKFIEVEGQTDVRRRKNPKGDELKKWLLALDVIPFDDFHFDPNPNPDGKRLFEIHVVERDLHDLKRFAKDTGIYDMKVIEQLEGTSYRRQDEDGRKNNQADEPEDSEEVSRNRVTIKECWGDILDDMGHVVEENVVCAIANDQFLIRPPEKNPRFDGESPFVTASLIQNPRSVYGKGMLDGAAALNKTYNELFNLILDGAMSEAQDVKVMNIDALHDPSQVEDGIEAGDTLYTTNQAGGQDPMRSVQTGRVPQGAMTFMEKMEAIVKESAYSSELHAGQLPAASTKATAIVEAQSSIAGVFGGLVRVFEQNYAVPVLEKVWSTLLQNMGHPNFMDEEVIAAIGKDKAKAIFDMSPEERFRKGSLLGKIKVDAISSFITKSREFGKLTTFLGVLQDPDLRGEFKKENDLGKFMDEVIKAIGIDATKFKMSESQKNARNRVESLMQAALSQVPQGPSNQKATNQAQLETEPGVPAEVQQ